MSALKQFEGNMEENIEAMNSLMEAFDCDLSVIEELLLMCGKCYYYDINDDSISEIFLTLNWTDDLTAVFQVLFLGSDKPAQTITPIDVYIYCSTDIEDLERTRGQMQCKKS